MTDSQNVMTSTFTPVKKLTEVMGTVYCEEENRWTIRKISYGDGNISEKVFVRWYMEWLFGDGDDESDYTEDEENENESHGDIVKRMELSKSQQEREAAEKASAEKNGSNSSNLVMGHSKLGMTKVRKLVCSCATPTGMRQRSMRRRHSPPRPPRRS